MVKSLAVQRAGSSAIRDLLEITEQPHVLSLAGGLPHAGTFPVDAIARASAAALAEDPLGALQYGPTEGYRPLRRWVAVRHGLGTGAAGDDRVIVTSGSQQALDLLTRALVDPGGTIALADPAYVGALQTFRAAGADLLAIPADRDGLPRRRPGRPARRGRAAHARLRRRQLRQPLGRHAVAPAPHRPRRAGGPVRVLDRRRRPVRRAPLVGHRTRSPCATSPTGRSRSAPRPRSSPRGCAPGGPSAPPEIQPGDDRAQAVGRPAHQLAEPADRAPGRRPSPGSSPRTSPGCARRTSGRRTTWSRRCASGLGDRLTVAEPDGRHVPVGRAHRPWCRHRRPPGHRDRPRRGVRARCRVRRGRRPPAPHAAVLRDRQPRRSRPAPSTASLGRCNTAEAAMDGSTRPEGTCTWISPSSPSRRTSAAWVPSTGYLKKQAQDRAPIVGDYTKDDTWPAWPWASAASWRRSR